MSASEIEIDRSDVKKRLWSQLATETEQELHEAEVEAIAGVVVTILAFPDLQSPRVLPPAFAFDPNLRITVEERLLDSIIVLAVGVFTGQAIESIGPIDGALAAYSAYLINCVPEIRTWIRSFTGLSDKKARLVVNLVKVAGPIAQSQLVEQMEDVGIPHAECDSLLQSLQEKNLIIIAKGQVALHMSDLPAKLLQQTDLSESKKKANSRHLGPGE